MKVFLDTNVVVSAFATRGLCADLLHVLLAEHERVLGETVLAEVGRVLSRKFRVPRSGVDEIETFLRRQTLVVAAPRPHASKRLDASDARVVAEAIEAGVDVLVTGDADLLDLADAPVRIVSPRGLWELLRRSQ